MCTVTLNGQLELKCTTDTLLAFGLVKLHFLLLHFLLLIAYCLLFARYCILCILWMVDGRDSLSIVRCCDLFILALVMHLGPYETKFLSAVYMYTEELQLSLTWLDLTSLPCPSCKSRALSRAVSMTLELSSIRELSANQIDSGV